jgi:peptidyl-prolyl cis-trans isomerase C
MNKVSLLALLSVLVISACDVSTPIAKIDGQKISQQEIDEYMKFKGNFNVADNQKKEILKTYVERKALTNAIAKESFMDNAQIEVELEEFRKQMLISRYFDKFLADRVTNKAIENFYSINISQFQSTKVKVAHILFRTRKEMSENEQQAKLTQAHEIYSKLIAGESFEELAANFSEDKNSAKKGGNLGWLKEGAIDPIFSEKAFSLAKDTFSDPIRTAFGFHIIKIQESPEVITKALEKVKGDIRYQLRNKAKESELERLMSQVTVEFN